MTDTNEIAVIMEEFPSFSYELNKSDDNDSIELCINGQGSKRYPGTFRKVRKVFDKQEDVDVLRQVLKGKEGV